MLGFLEVKGISKDSSEDEDKFFLTLHEFQHVLVLY